MTSDPARPTLVVDDAGAGPVVVLLHGLGGFSELWADTLESLRTSGYRAIAYDQRGHGNSPDAIPPWTIDDLATDLLDLLDARRIGRACVVGHSMGGRAMFSFALDHPDRLTALVAVGAHSEAPRAIYQDILADIRQVTAREGVVGFRRAFEAAGEIPARALTDRAYAARYDAWFARNRGPMLVASLDAILSMPTLTPRLSEIAVPMLAVVGATDDHFLELAHHYATVVPDCRSAVVPATGHYPMVDAPAAFAASLLGFLGRVPVDA